MIVELVKDYIFYLWVFMVIVKVQYYMVFVYIYMVIVIIEFVGEWEGILKLCQYKIFIIFKVCLKIKGV